MDLYLRTNRVLWLPQHQPGKSFAETKTPAVHLGFRYESGKSWRGYYAAGELAEEVRALYEDCRALGRRVIETSKTPGQSRRLLRN